MTYSPQDPNFTSTGKRKSGLALFSLILGILAFCLTVVAGVPAIILGIIALKRSASQPDVYGGRGLAIAGIITGAVGCVFIAPMALMIAILLPSLGRAREMANRTACMVNISSVLKASIVYASENNDSFPVTRGNGEAGTTTYVVDPAGNNSRGIGNPSDATIDPNEALANYYKGTTNFNNPTSCIWILVLKSTLSPKALICKSDPLSDSAGAPLMDVRGNCSYGPDSISHFSYSLAFPWDPKAAGHAPWWSAAADTDTPLLADIGRTATFAPGSAKPLNSPNHGGDGQQVGYGDAHVEWKNTVVAGAFRGGSGDSIYHVGGWSPGGNFSLNQIQTNDITTATPSWNDPAYRPRGGYDAYLIPNRDGGIMH